MSAPDGSLEMMAPPSVLSPLEFTINRARALFDADAYREMIAMAGRAERSIRLEFFLFGGPVAAAMTDLLADKQRAGVDVRVTLDRARGMLPSVRRECRATHRQLRAKGIDVVLSDARSLPNSPARPAVSHHKFLVVDDREAMVGGMNVGSLFFRHHDVMISLAGPAAAALGQQFDADRRFVLDPRAPRPTGSPPVPPFSHASNPSRLAGDESWVRLLGTGVGRRTTKQALVQNLRAARSSIALAMSEIGRTDLLFELIAAQQRGVDVRVLVDPQDMQEYLPPVLGPVRQRFPKGILNALAVRTLVEGGVPVRLYEVGKEFALLHMKMIVFDGQSAIVGSTNWAPGGLEWVSETDVELQGGRVIDELLAQFDLDWDRAGSARIPSRTVQLLCRMYERFVR